MQHELDQVDREIEFIARVLSRTPDHDPKMILLLICLGRAHTKRFEFRQELDDIHKAIEYRSIALTLNPDDLSLADLHSELGIAHLMRFRRLGDKHDMEKATEHQSLGLQLFPEGYSELPRHLSNLALSYIYRFKHLGETEDIEKAIKYNSQAVEMTPKDHPHLPQSLEGLATSHRYRFQLFGELNDLESAAIFRTRALALTPDDHPKLSSRLANLAVSHSDRFERLGELNDLEKAIQYKLRALDLTPDGHPDMSQNLANLAVSYKDRFERLGELVDLGQSIQYGLRALTLTPDDDPNLSTRYGNQAVSHKDRFLRLGELSDLEQAIEYELRALALTPDGHPHLPSRFANLAGSHTHRFQLLDELSDLEQAIKYGSHALTLTPDDRWYPHLTTYLGNLGVSHRCRFERLGELSDIEQAIKYISRALSLTPEDHPHLLIHLDNLAISHSSRFQRLGELRDVDQAIEYGLRALALTPDNHPHLPVHLANLAESHKDRFRHQGKLSDLEQAIEYESCALAAITHDHPDSCSWHYNHAFSYFYYYNYSHNPSHLQQSLPLFRNACMSSSGSSRDRFRHAHRWAALATKHSGLNPIEAYQATIDLLPQFIWLGATADQRYHDLKAVESLAVDAVHAAILFSNYSMALEWLEHARCVVWSQNLMLRSPLDQLLASHPALAARLRTISDQLHTASSTSRESQAVSRSLTSEQVAQEHRYLAKQYEDLLAQVRSQSGFEHFLRPMKANRLMCAAQIGPLVVINCHDDGCNALVILPSRNTVDHVSLPGFSRKKAQDAHSTIRSLLGQQGIRERGVRVRQEPGREADFESVLRILWADVVKPVLEFLGYITLAQVDTLPHITWCPTGTASFLPLHAAGDYDQPRSRVFDYVISSYTPTLAALLHSTPSTLGRDSRVLAVGQAATTGHSPLPGTMMELKVIKSHIQTRAGYSELINAQATPATVLDAMEQHDWVHLACHAHQNVNDPTKSGFFLHNGTLDLAAINRRSFKKKGLAFLSACQTATGDEKLPDEAVHLASGMLMAGYSSVIATMWSVGDSDAPLVADKVYSQLMKQGTLGNGEAGRALHAAVDELRARIGEKQFGRWVPFIHIGS